MSLQDNILDVRRLCLQGDFNCQVDYLLDNIRLKRAEVEELGTLFEDVERRLQIAWPGCQIYPFGSIVTGLGIKTSDVDCFIALPSEDRTPDGKVVLKAKQILSKYHDVFSDLFAIPMAKVPIVKFYHIPTRRHCDVSFKSPSGVQNSRLLGYLLHMDDRALPLAIIIKYWSKIHNLTGTNLLPNYALTLLVIFYLQQMNILPPVYMLQMSGQPHMIDNWNTEFSELDYETNNNATLFHLLGGFFEYYRDFDYMDYVISPYMGCPMDKKLLNKAEGVPEEFELYKHNLRMKVCQPLQMGKAMCVQDPFVHCRNCTVAVYPKLAQTVMAQFRNAAAKFDEDNRQTFLKEILNKPYHDEKSSDITRNWRKVAGRVTKPSQFVRAARGRNANHARRVKQDFSRPVWKR